MSTYEELEIGDRVQHVRPEHVGGKTGVVCGFTAPDLEQPALIRGLIEVRWPGIARIMHYDPLNLKRIGISEVRYPW